MRVAAPAVTDHVTGAWLDGSPPRSVTSATNADVASTPDRKSTRLNSSHLGISYAVFCLKKESEAGAFRCGELAVRKADRPAARARILRRRSDGASGRRDASAAFFLKNRRTPGSPLLPQADHLAR